MKNRNIIYRIVAAAMSLSLMLGAAACKKKIPFKDKSTVALADKDSVKFDMSVEKVGSRKILVTLTNKSDTMYLAGQTYSLEYKDGKDWYQVPSECFFTMEAYLLAPAGDPELSNNWSQKLYLSDYCKEALPAGHYRVIKSVMQDVENSEQVYLAAEFDLEKEVSDPQEKSTITDDQIISADQYVLPVSGVELGIVNEMKIKVATARLMKGERSFILEYKQDGIWYTKEIKGYGGEADSSAEYGQLDLYPAEAFAKGTYRLLQEQSKDSSGKTLYACYEFTI